MRKYRIKESTLIYSKSTRTVYEIETKFWFCPFWIGEPYSTHFDSIKEADDYISKLKELESKEQKEKFFYR